MSFQDYFLLSRGILYNLKDGGNEALRTSAPAHEFLFRHPDRNRNNSVSSRVFLLLKIKLFLVFHHHHLVGPAVLPLSSNEFHHFGPRKEKNGPLHLYSNGLK